MKYLSVCSGVGTDHVAWEALGWECVGFAEIEPFPSAILAHRYPGVRNHGDFTTIPSYIGPIDLLVGGTPCQSFSVAGQRAGLDDPRGNLTLEFARLARRVRARWIVWENVPGVLSSDGGRDFAAILTAFRECGYSVCYRVLDAQHFGVPQRRRRVFVVGYLGDDWRPSAEVLLEQASMRGDSAKGRAARQEVAGTLGGDSGSRGWSSDLDRTTFIPVQVDANRVNGAVSRKWSKGSGGPAGDEAYNLVSGAWWDGGQLSQTLDSVIAKQQMMPEKNRFPVVLQTAIPVLAVRTASLRSSVSHNSHLALPTVVRRLTPRECERLQGLPDDWTLVPYRGKPASDSPRYKAIGNGMAMPVLRWIGQRIAMVEGEMNA